MYIVQVTNRTDVFFAWHKAYFMKGGLWWTDKKFEAKKFSSKKKAKKAYKKIKDRFYWDIDHPRKFKISVKKVK